MMDSPVNFAMVAAASMFATSCNTAPRDHLVNSNQPLQTASVTQGNKVMDETLPVNQRFRNLDEYLAWLQQHAAPADRPWYKEVSPGIYELQTAGNLHLDVPSNEKRTFTREELERKFGFRK